MSYALVLVFEGVTEDDYWKVNDSLGVGRDGSGDWPDGILSHAGGPTPNGWLVIEKWESKAAQEAFMASRLGAAIAAAGVPAPVQILETNTVNDQHFKDRGT
jgi:hypothetical protein